jgi:hypothetical protein
MRTGVWAEPRRYIIVHTSISSLFIIRLLCKRLLSPCSPTPVIVIRFCLYDHNQVPLRAAPVTLLTCPCNHITIFDYNHSKVPLRAASCRPAYLPCRASCGVRVRQYPLCLRFEGIALGPSPGGTCQETACKHIQHFILRREEASDRLQA